jgi:hypothetical protein
MEKIMINITVNIVQCEQALLVKSTENLLTLNIVYSTEKLEVTVNIVQYEQVLLVKSTENLLTLNIVYSTLTNDRYTVNNVQYERVLLVKLTENLVILNIVYSKQVLVLWTLFGMSEFCYCKHYSM